MWGQSPTALSRDGSERPVDPRNVLRTIQIAAAKAGVDGVGVHTLRHSAAVGWLEGGVHIKAVADMLGHSSISITGDIYGHTSDETARSAVDVWSGALACERQNHTPAYP